MTSLTHRRMRRHVAAYVDGELRGEAKAGAVKAHLDECWDCSGDAEALLLMKRSLARLAHRQPADLARVRIRRWAEHLVS